MITREGLLVYDPEWHNYNWPDIFENSWIQVDTEADSNNFKHARLVLNSRFENKSIVLTDYDPLNDVVVAKFMWCEHLDTYEISGLFVDGEYQNSGIGYFIAKCMRNWLIATYKKIVTAPDPKTRTVEVERIVKRGAVEWEDETLIFLEEADGQYYTYSKWKEVYP
jgi:GNAT superfamily N-acetyltransferase